MGADGLAVVLGDLPPQVGHQVEEERVVAGLVVHVVVDVVLDGGVHAGAVEELDEFAHEGRLEAAVGEYLEDVVVAGVQLGADLADRAPGVRERVVDVAQVRVALPQLEDHVLGDVHVVVLVDHDRVGVEPGLLGERHGQVPVEEFGAGGDDLLDLQVHDVVQVLVEGLHEDVVLRGPSEVAHLLGEQQGLLVLGEEEAALREVDGLAGPGADGRAGLPALRVPRGQAGQGPLGRSVLLVEGGHGVPLPGHAGHGRPAGVPCDVGSGRVRAAGGAARTRG
ncbi:hypothetical protein SGLAM104S_05300 [Streptomyces glaucescens]